MVDWQVTATTIYCDSMADEVTIMVFKDRTVKCTGYKSFPSGQARKGQAPKCEGLECPRIMPYRDKLFAEEAK